MYKEKKIIAIIPARSGSKGLKDKNIKDLNGKPMIAYTIEAATETKIIDTLFVSTDSEQYAEVAKTYGAEVPFLRDKINATDKASSWDVVRESLKKYSQLGKEFDICILLQPTSPLRTSEDIKNAIDVLIDKQANAVVGMCECEHSPLWSNTLDVDNSLVGFLNNSLTNKPRQQIETYYRINGAIYVVNTEFICRTNNLYQQNNYAYIMPKERSIDIDDIYDFWCAEAIMKHIK